MFELDMRETKQHRDGVWFDAKSGDVVIDQDKMDDRPYLLIAREQNRNYLQALDNARKGLKTKMRKDNLTQEEGLEAICAATAKGILLDWKNVKDVEGNDLKATEDNRYRALRHNPEFRELVGSLACDFRAFSEKANEERAGKSRGGSSGGKRTAST